METQTEYTSHDRLFKELFRTFFVELLEIFAPKMLECLDTSSLEFLDKEFFTDPLTGERKEADLAVKAKYKDKDTFFLIHLENQSTAQADFNDRMFGYFYHLRRTYGYPVYPIAILSYDKPYKPAPDSLSIEFPDLKVLKYRYRVIQLNRLGWRKFLHKPNPVASALMAKMKIAPQDRPKVKLEALKMLAGLKLNDAETYLVSGFIGTYLKLDRDEQAKFDKELGKVMSPQKEETLEIITDWMERGIEKGLEQGKADLIMRQIRRRLGVLTPLEEEKVKALTIVQLDELGEALLDFGSRSDLTKWLENNLPKRTK
jgi:predicted transposase YdaD